MLCCIVTSVFDLAHLSSFVGNALQWKTVSFGMGFWVFAFVWLEDQYVVFAGHSSRYPGAEGCRTWWHTWIILIRAPYESLTEDDRYNNYTNIFKSTWQPTFGFLTCCNADTSSWKIRELHAKETNSKHESSGSQDLWLSPGTTVSLYTNSIQFHLIPV